MNIDIIAVGKIKENFFDKGHKGISKKAFSLLQSAHYRGCRRESPGKLKRQGERTGTGAGRQ